MSLFFYKWQTQGPVYKYSKTLQLRPLMGWLIIEVEFYLTWLFKTFRLMYTNINAMMDYQ